MNLKSHFQFSKKQRSGIFLLIVIIVLLQSIYVYTRKPKAFSNAMYNDKEIEKFQKQLDSLRKIKNEESQPQIFPFNPNFITDYRGYTLGMSNDEIDRLLQFRAQDKWINSVSQFQEVTQVSDSLLNTISPYIKFPDWVTNPKPKASTKSFEKTLKTFDEKQDLNTASAEDLTKVNGIGEVLSNRIIRYRDRFEGGFIHDIQLQDIYGLTDEVITKITNDFTVKTPRRVEKFNLNTITIEELVTIDHIDYELANEIIEQRILRDGYSSIEELTKVKGFPVKKIEIIKLFLTL